jgi:[ribosomal protein S18]-alanine N-acetyltransferase
LHRYPGVALIDAPGANPAASSLLQGLQFRPIGTTLRMVRGEDPRLSLGDVYGLACLELG